MTIAGEPRPTDWADEARCLGVDPDLFFPERGETHAGLKAKAVCSACPVREPCLGYAMTYAEKHGVWGGLSERERRALRRRGWRAGDPMPAVNLNTGGGDEDARRTPARVTSRLDAVVALRARGVPDLIIAGTLGMTAGAVATAPTRHAALEARRATKAG